MPEPELPEPGTWHKLGEGHFLIIDECCPYSWLPDYRAVVLRRETEITPAPVVRAALGRLRRIAGQG